MINKLIHSALFGIAVGDALGVPVEFRNRDYLKGNPVTDMLAYGTHNQPAGTWSDDSSLTFCLAESLTRGYNLKDMGMRFVSWYEDNYWTPHGTVFDVGVATSRAIYQLMKDVNPVMAGGREESDNGNGSLMRIMPLLFHVQHMDITERFRYIQDVSSLTHGHIRSVLACFIYLEFALRLIETGDKYKAFEKIRGIVNDFLHNNPICSDNEINKFHRILLNPIGDYEIRPVYEYSEAEISSSGYVVHSLEAALWCLFKEDTYEGTVLRAVNLGGDTDTTAAIAGGLAGLLYGFDAIPLKWIGRLARKDDIMDLCDRLDAVYNKSLQETMEVIISKIEKLHINDDYAFDAYFDQICDMFRINEENTITVLSSMSKKNIEWVAPMFEDLSYAFQSKRFIECLEAILDKYLGDLLAMDVQEARDAMDDE